MRAHLLTVAVACVLAAGCKKSAAPPQRGPMGPAEVDGRDAARPRRSRCRPSCPGAPTASLASEVRPQITRHRQGAHVRGGRAASRPGRCSTRSIRRMYRAALARRRGGPREREGVARGRRSSRTSGSRASRRSRACRSRRPTTRALAHAARGRDRRAEAGRARDRADQPRLHVDQGADQRAGSASRRSPPARSSPRTSRSRSRRSARSIRSTSTSPSRARRGCGCAPQLGAGDAAGRHARRSSCMLGDGSHVRARTARSSSPRSRSTRRPARVTLRAKFPNPDDTLLPGMYVRAVLDQAVDSTRSSRRSRASRTTRRATRPRWSSAPDGKVELRTLVADRAIGDRWLVDERPQGRRQADRRGHSTRSARACRCTRPSKSGAHRRRLGARRLPDRSGCGIGASRRTRSTDMLARFFANRPVFAWVISIVIMLAGVGVDPRAAGRAVSRRRAAEREHLAPATPARRPRPSRTASPRCSSSSSPASTACCTSRARRARRARPSINVTFKQGTNPDTAQVQVQNKVQQAIPRLPPAVQQQGIVVTKAQTNFLTIVAIYDETDKATDGDIADYLAQHAAGSDRARQRRRRDPDLRRRSYAMRIWLDPTKLLAYSLMPSDIEAAIARAERPGLGRQDRRAAGAAGPAAQRDGDRAVASCTPPSEFKRHHRQARPDRRDRPPRRRRARRARQRGVRLRDAAQRPPGVGHRRACSRRTRTRSRSPIAVKDAVEQPRAHDAARAGRSSYPFDSTKFIRLSIEEVVKTLIEAIVLVVLVMFIFLQSWRATLIPVIAVPVVLLGTFCVLRVLGYSINTLTMFALVLSIGLLVDDAIVVVENVERLMREEDLSPLDATIRSMKEITGALIGVATVLSAVFLPMAFFSGSTGVIYRQFSVTIVASMLLSVFVALTVTPALCASLLAHSHATAPRRGPFGWFNRGFDRMTRGYRGVDRVDAARAGQVARAVRRRSARRWACSSTQLPTGFLPQEDQGIGMVIWTLPVGRDAAAHARGRARRSSSTSSASRRRTSSRCSRSPGFSLRRRRPERRHGVRRAQGLGRAPGQGQHAPRRSSNRATGMLSTRARRVHLRADAAGDPGPRPVRRASTSQLQATPGTDRAGARAGARSAARRWRTQDPQLVGGAPRRSAGDAAAQDRHRSGQGRRARPRRRPTSRTR